MENIDININGKVLSVKAESTILEAATANGIAIPTLCALKGIDSRASCRMCVVEVSGARVFQPACATKVSKGMAVNTDTDEIRQSRKTTLELLLSRHAVDCHHCLRIGNSKCDDLDPNFCEMCFFCDCVRDGFCELQALAREYQVDVLPYPQENIEQKIDVSTGSIIRNPNKCIKCRRCVDVCNEVQTVHNLSIINRGSSTKIVPEMDKSMKDSPCVQCGRCVDVCPTGSIFIKEHKDEAVYYAHKYGTDTAAFISSNVLKKLAELFRMDTPVMDAGLVVAGLRKIGMDYVYTDEVVNQLSAQDGKRALLKALDTEKETVIITDSYAAEKFVKQNFAKLAQKLVTYDSPQRIFAKNIKQTFARNQNPDFRLIAITEGGENAAEAYENKSVDFVIPARELYRIFLRTGVDPKQRKPLESDRFEVSRDVLPPMAFFAPVEWSMEKEIKQTEIVLNGKNMKAAISTNLGQAGVLLEQVQNGNSPYKVIRINA
ncbi:MAG: [Fe-Fe] hydrogenase large subunit C-terminal domain-containing protein [Acetobacterium sp.]|uniref:[Fe-Fe] hydrogenase large subunit C-terminal domain-containing protein n=1 Tax=Acetobacterium sp. TaxID=1872094 RepID=UPI003242B19C